MQKTAYDMLMSDWSSDVCASDLAKGTHADQCLELQGGTVTLKNVAEIASWYIYLTNSNMLRRDGHRQARCPVTARTWSRSARSRIVTSSTAKPPSSGRPRDRTSVALGKRLSVRVDHGGRGLIRKTK